MAPILNPQVKCTQLFINNQFVNAASGKTFDTLNPATGKAIATCQEANVEDVNRAVQAAKEAMKFGSDYRNLNASQRGALLYKLSELMERDADYLASLESYNNGKLFHRSMEDVYGSIHILRFYAGLADKMGGSVIPADGKNFCFTRYEPIGIVGAILPWNYPLEMAVIKLAPSIAAGNAIVIKPAEQTPLTTLYMAALAKEAGFPAGVVNVVLGFGPTTGQPIVEHPDVRLIAFTGSTEVGRLIQREAAKTIKRVSLELGGKSPLIIFGDADLDKAVKVAHTTALINQGQCCVAATRTFVHESIYDQFVAKTAELAKQYKIGNPLEEGVNHGPQIDQDQTNKVMELIESGKKEGARVVMGGNKLAGPGYFIEPTVFADVTDDMRIAKEEIFGPVQSILKFSSKEEVIERANNSIYGLGAGLFTKDLNLALEVSARLEAGQVYVNEYFTPSVQMPFGGFKQSGINREFGVEGLRHFYEIKNVCVDLPFKI